MGWESHPRRYQQSAGRGELIGKKSTFTFKLKEETRGQWTMHEYYLEGASMEGLNPEDTSSELCRIKRDDSKSSKGGKLVIPQELAPPSNPMIRG